MVCAPVVEWVRMDREQERFERLQDIETEITEALALLGRWSHLYEKLRPGQKNKWKAIVARAQGSGDRITVSRELDSFINTTLKPLVERLD